MKNHFWSRLMDYLLFFGIFCCAVLIFAAMAELATPDYPTEVEVYTIGCEISNMDITTNPKIGAMVDIMAHWSCSQFRNKIKTDFGLFQELDVLRLVFGKIKLDFYLIYDIIILEIERKV